MWFSGSCDSSGSCGSLVLVVLMVLLVLWFLWFSGSCGSLVLVVLVVLVVLWFLWLCQGPENHPRAITGVLIPLCNTWKSIALDETSANGLFDHFVSGDSVPILCIDDAPSF